MPDDATTDVTTGAEPSVTTPAANSTPAAADSSADNRIDAAGITSIGDFLDKLPEDAINAMSGDEFDKLTSGDKETLAKYFKGEPTPTPDTAQNPSVQPDAKADEDEDKGIERISLRKMSRADQHRIAAVVAAVKEGKSLDEAIAAIVSPGATTAKAETASTPEPEVEPENIAQLRAKVKELETKPNWDHASVSALVRLRLQLDEAEKTHKAQQLSDNEWSAKEAEHIAAAQKTFATELANPVFAQAFADARDLAEHRNDPVMQSPDWSMVIANKIKQQLAKAAPFPAAPQAGAKGMVASPGVAATPTMTIPEALTALDKLPEDQIDAVLAGIRQREAQARLRGK